MPVPCCSRIINRRGPARICRKGAIVFADLIFTNAAVFQAAGAEPADSVAVRGDSIVAVGRGIDRDLVGMATEITDLGGASLLPGFIDAHAHPVAAGMAALRCDLSGLPHDRKSYL